MLNINQRLLQMELEERISTISMSVLPDQEDHALLISALHRYLS
ncbi:hypothetical protein [Paenibacillus sp. FJAT-27812]|nr:hypothetical protein [Paenibacillus sp. FJAT-27812]